MARLLTAAALCLLPAAVGASSACRSGGSGGACPAPGVGDRGTVLLQRTKTGRKVMLSSELEDFPELVRRREEEMPAVVADARDGPLPLCHEAIVAATCANLNGGQRGVETVSLRKIQELLSLNASTMEDLWSALNFTGAGTSVPCSLLCESVVRYVKAYGVLPPTSDRACSVVGGTPKCDLDVSPPKLVRDLSGGDDFRPDGGFRAEGGPALLSSASGGGLVRHRLESTKEGLRVVRERVAADLREKRLVAKEEAQEWLKRKFCPYSLWEAVELIANFFRIYPSSGRRPMISVPPSLAQGGAAAAAAEEMIVGSNAEAKAWVAQVVVELANRRTSSYRQKWFGGSGSLSPDDVRDRIILAMDFIERELDEVRYVFPADVVADTACDGNTAAYVWKSGGGAAGYEETTGPLCDAGDSPFGKHCGVDSSGRFFVYLCRVWAEDPKSWRIATLVHEAAHHAGPADWSYDRATMKGFSQARQLDNAASYQHFAQDVASAAWGCTDKASPSFPFSCGSVPCTCPPLAGYCEDPTYGPAVSAECPMTCGSCGGSSPTPSPATSPKPSASPTPSAPSAPPTPAPTPSAPPTPAPTPAPTPPPGGCMEPSSKVSITLGGITYTAECSAFASSGVCGETKVQTACPVSCNVCSVSSPGCTDDPGYSIQTQVGLLMCSDWKQYVCWEEVKEHCPVSCRVAGCV